ncbi:MAG: hypothetical protein V1859_10050 [archaeon]
MDTPKNTEVKYVYVGLIIAIIGISLIFLPFILDMNMMNGGYAMIFISGALVVPAGIITAAIYSTRASALNKILSKDDFIAHWTYTHEEWDKYTEKEKKDEYEAKIGLWKLLIAISAVVGIGFFIWAKDKEAALISISVIVGVIIFIRILIFFQGRHLYALNKNNLGFAYIGKKGILLNQCFHSWNFLSWFENAEVDNKKKLLIITYSALAKHGKDYFTLRVPIPKGCEKEAVEVAKKLMD